MVNDDKNLNGAKAIARFWYPDPDTSALSDEQRQKLLKLAKDRRKRCFEKVITRCRTELRTLHDGSLPHLPKNKFGHYQVTVRQARAFYLEFVNPPREDFLPPAHDPSNRGKFIAWTREMIEGAPGRYLGGEDWDTKEWEEQVATSIKEGLWLVPCEEIGTWRVERR
jgi:hypothetical protein